MPPRVEDGTGMGVQQSRGVGVAVFDAVQKLCLELQSLRLKGMLQ
jgi:hypothetical protein